MDLSVLDTKHQRGSGLRVRASYRHQLTHAPMARSAIITRFGVDRVYTASQVSGLGVYKVDVWARSSLGQSYDCGCLEEPNTSQTIDRFTLIYQVHYKVV